MRYALFVVVGLLGFQNWAVYDGAYWDDLRFPANVIISGPGAGNAADRSLFGTLLFASNQDEEAFLTVQMPHGYVQGTNFIPHVHWSKTTAAGGDVVWKMDYDCKDKGETFTGALGTTATFTYVIDDADTAHLNAKAAISGGFDPGFSIVSGMCIIRIWRDVSEDDYAADAELYEFDIHYQIDQPGSRSELVK